MVFSKFKHWSTSPGFQADGLPLSSDCFNWKISNFRRSSLIFSCKGQWTLWVMTWKCRKTQAWHCQTLICVAKHKHVSFPMILSCIVEVKRPVHTKSDTTKQQQSHPKPSFKLSTKCTRSKNKTCNFYHYDYCSFTVVLLHILVCDKNAVYKV